MLCCEKCHCLFAQLALRRYIILPQALSVSAKSLSKNRTSWTAKTSKSFATLKATSFTIFSQAYLHLLSSYTPLLWIISFLYLDCFVISKYQHITAYVKKYVAKPSFHIESINWRIVIEEIESENHFIRERLASTISNIHRISTLLVKTFWKPFDV